MFNEFITRGEIKYIAMAKGKAEGMKYMELNSFCHLWNEQCSKPEGSTVQVSNS